MKQKRCCTTWRHAVNAPPVEDRLARSAVTQDCLGRRCRAMTPPCVVPTFRPYTVENLEFGGFYAWSCESRAKLKRAAVAGRRRGRAGFVEEQGDEKKSARAGSSRCVLWGAVGGRHGSGAKIGGRPQGLFLRQPGEHVGPRGGDDRRRGPDDGRLQ